MSQGEERQKKKTNKKISAMHRIKTKRCSGGDEEVSAW